MWGSELHDAIETVELICPNDDYLDILFRQDQETFKRRSDQLSEQAHFLRKKWLPSRPKKVRWRKG